MTVFQEGLADFKGDADACELLDFSGRTWQLGVDDGHHVKRLIARGVVVGYDEVDVILFGNFDGLVTRDAAIDRQKQVVAGGGRLLDGFGGQAVAVVNSMRKVALHSAAVAPQDPCH